MRPIAALDLETVLTGKAYADVQASALQRAIARVVDGKAVGDLLSPEEQRKYFGVGELPADLLPTLVVLVCGVRGGKTLLACCAALSACMTVDLSKLKQHEVPRFVIVAPRIDTATPTFRMLRGIAEGSRIYRQFIVGTPTTDTMMVLRPDGRRVEICVVAAAAGGVTLRNVWLVGAIIEEVAQLGVEVLGAAVSAEELYRAAVTRLLPGARCWIISSPFGPQGLLWNLYQQHFGRPGRTLVVHAPTRALNPSISQEQVDAIRAESPDVAAREYDAAWLDAETSFLEAALIDGATRAAPIDRPRPLSWQCWAGGDFATRGNDWTIAIATAERRPTGHRIIVLSVRRWQGSKSQPLSPAAVFAEAATWLRPYGVRKICVDAWSFDAMRDLARAAGLDLEEVPIGDRLEMYGRLRKLAANGALELPPHPLVRADLLGLKKVATAGGVRIDLPKTPDGRHCDFAPSIAIAVMNADRSGPRDELTSREFEHRMNQIGAAIGYAGVPGGHFGSPDDEYGLGFTMADVIAHGEQMKGR